MFQVIYKRLIPAKLIGPLYCTDNKHWPKLVVYNKLNIQNEWIKASGGYENL